MQDESVEGFGRIAGMTEDRLHRGRNFPKGEVEDVGAVHGEIGRMTTVTLIVFRLVQRPIGLTRSALPHDDGFGSGAIGAEDEMPRRGPAGLFDDRRRAGVSEQRVGRTVAGIRQPAERIPRAQEHAGGPAMGAEQGGLVQAIDPTGTTEREIVSRCGFAQAQPSVQQRGVIGLRMIRGLGDEDDGVDGSSVGAHFGEQSLRGVRAEVQGRDSGRDDPALTESDGLGGALQRRGIDARRQSVRDEIAHDRTRGHGKAGEADVGEGGVHFGKVED